MDRRTSFTHHGRDRFTYGGIMNVDVKITSHTLSNKEGDRLSTSKTRRLKGVSLSHSHHGQEHVLCGTIQRSTVQWRMSQRSGRLLHRWDGKRRESHAIGCRRTVRSCTQLPKRPTIPTRPKSDPGIEELVPNHHATYQSAKPNRLASTSTSPCTTSTSTSLLSCSGSSVSSPTKRSLKPSRRKSDGHYVEEELGGCAYECYRLGIYDRPSAMCYLMENTSLTEYLASIATMKPTSTKLSRR
jgi:hypothetical protein